jgi:hypothetical protein
MNVKTYELKHPFNDEITRIILKAPTTYHYPLVSKIKSMLWCGFKSLNESVIGDTENNKSASYTNVQDVIDATQEMDEPENDDILKNCTINELMGTLSMVPSKDYSFYPTLLTTLRDLLLSDGICTIDGTHKKLSAGYLDRFAIDDFEAICMTYLKNFFSVSPS